MGICTPTRFVVSVERINLDELWDQGKRCILLDRDNTLVPRDTKVAPESVRQWLSCAAEKGFKLCLVSNNWHKDQVFGSAQELGCEAIHFALKPLPFAITKAAKKMGATADQTVMIGDQLYTDIMGANFAHVDSVLVKPQATKDMWYTYIFRAFEHVALRNIEFEE